MEYKNNFGFLRLLFASLVIFSHSPEIIDGNRNREFLTGLFGTTSLGELAVSGFFLISGYLILKSFESSNTIKDFLVKRILRIYPAFIVASLFCIIIIGPLSGGFNIISNLNQSDWLKLLTGFFILDIPEIQGIFPSNHVKSINGSMWTIWIEFLCYFSIPILSLIGVYRRNLLLITTMAVTSFFLFLQISGKDFWIPYPARLSAYASSRLLCAFLIGGLFYKYDRIIKWNTKSLIIGFFALIILLMNQSFAFIGLYIFGGYLLFNFALNYKNPIINRIGQKNDISYGLYLYAWPIQSIVVQYYPNIDPMTLSIMTLILAGLMGYISWTFVEKPFAKLKIKFISTPKKN